MTEWTRRERYDEPPSSIRWAVGWAWTLLKCRLVGHRFEYYRTDDPDWPLTLPPGGHVETRYCLRCDDTWERPVGVSISLQVSKGQSTDTG